jgi:hypothetical protein
MNSNELPILNINNLNNDDNTDEDTTVLRALKMIRLSKYPDVNTLPHLNSHPKLTRELNHYNKGYIETDMLHALNVTDSSGKNVTVIVVNSSNRIRTDYTYHEYGKFIGKTFPNTPPISQEIHDKLIDLGFCFDDVNTPVLDLCFDNIDENCHVEDDDSVYHVYECENCNMCFDDKKQLYWHNTVCGPSTEILNDISTYHSNTFHFNVSDEEFFGPLLSEKSK